MYALTIPSNSGNDPVEEPFLHSLNKLLMNLLSLGNSIYLNESSDLKFLWCNTLKREFSVILNILEQIDQDSGRSFSSSEAQAKPLVVTNKFLSDLILVVQTAGAGVSLTKTLCGDSMSLAYMYVINSMFWELCAKVLKVLQGQFKAPSSTALSRNKFPYSTLAKNKPKHVTTNVYAYITRVVNHLCMTIPTKYELFHEINKLMAGKSAIHTEYLPDEDNRFLSTLSGYIHEVASRQVTRRGSNNLRNGLANLVDIREMEESTDSVDSPLMPLQQDQLSFRVRYLLLGISYLFDCPGGVLKDGNESNMSLDFPDKSGWVSALTELLMMSISGNRKDYHGFSVDISCLSPFIAQLLLQISFHTDMKSSFDCIFWELAKVSFCFILNW